MPDSSVGSLEARLSEQMRDASIYCDGPAVPWMTARDIATAAVREARAATVQEIAAALMTDEAGAAYFTALGRDGRWDHHTMRPLAAAWEAVARRFASPTGDTDGADATRDEHAA